MQIVETVFWLSLLGAAYAYLVYPLLIYALARWVGHEPPRPWVGDGELPHVTLLIAAHNEQACIASRVRNALGATYNSDRLRIVVASDGSTDDTNAIVRAHEDERVQLWAFNERRGKSAMLNDAITRIGGGIIVLSDANTMYEPDAIAKLAAWFADPEVTAVCGRLVLTDPESGRNVDGLYWRYETFLKRCEARLGALLGANGAIYAIRADRYVPIPDNTIIDDFTIPLLAKLQHGGSIIYDASAVAHEETPPQISDEFRRRSRIGAGGYQSVALLWPLLNPKQGWTAFAFFSHKVLRWSVPLFLVAALSTNILLAREPLYAVLLIGQLGLYALGVVGVWIRGNGLLAKLARGVSLFCAMNAALAVGFWRWAFTPQQGTWQRTNR